VFNSYESRFEPMLVISALQEVAGRDRERHQFHGKSDFPVYAPALRETRELSSGSKAKEWCGSVLRIAL